VAARGISDGGDVGRSGICGAVSAYWQGHGCRARSTAARGRVGQKARCRARRVAARGSSDRKFLDVSRILSGRSMQRRCKRDDRTTGSMGSSAAARERVKKRSRTSDSA
jgi:hypothetical protein